MVEAAYKWDNLHLVEAVWITFHHAIQRPVSSILFYVEGDVQFDNPDCSTLLTYTPCILLDDFHYPLRPCRNWHSWIDYLQCSYYCNAVVLIHRSTKINFLLCIHFRAQRNMSPFHTQEDRHHETTTNRKSVKIWYVDYIGSIPTLIL